MRIPLRGAALEGDDALGAELDEQDDEEDHVGLRGQRVGGVQPLDALLQERRSGRRPASVPQTLPTPPTTTVMKLCTM
jgi:hypothetical protein